MCGARDDSGRATFNISRIFRQSAKVTLTIEIVSAVVMLGAIVAYLIGGSLGAIDPDLQVLLLLVGIIVTLLVFLAAFGAFVRLSGRIGDVVVGPGLDSVPRDTPRVKAVMYTYGILVILMVVTGIYSWYLVDKAILTPWAASLSSISLRIFGLALGAFVISLLIQIVIAVVGRTATRVVIEVLDMDDDSEFRE